jgi:hypothetical protein
VKRINNFTEALSISTVSDSLLVAYSIQAGVPLRPGRCPEAGSWRVSLLGRMPQVSELPLLSNSKFMGPTASR